MAPHYNKVIGVGITQWTGRRSDVECWYTSLSHRNMQTEFDDWHTKEERLGVEIPKWDYAMIVGTAVLVGFGFVGLAALLF
jgi:hypothetical protein